MARPTRTLSPTRIYHVMIRGIEKKNIFLDDEDHRKFLDILQKQKDQKTFKLLAYCLMPNHAHLILDENNSSISKIMQSINVSYAIYFNKKYNRVGHLFQDRFKSEVIDDESYLLTAIRYVHNNPIQAKLVSELHQYFWSSYQDYLTHGEKGGLVDTDFVLDIISPNGEKLLENFLTFSTLPDKGEFIYIGKEETINKSIRSKEEALHFANKLLARQNMSFDDIYQQRSNLKGSIKHALILQLKDQSNLSYRELGELMGLSKSTIHRLID
ncbi:REP element-mobilizing transposase RayT [Natronincola peptidivorans]|uniref:REP element-mobilizing transposase RayT n=1 Tax=Natronincola peptidivorans TaxID=426128 RepID=A0A1H9ZV61_9FIRM|nr:transposase [Natronincola peptidivorans]SES85256.1 REP element-mobilizing transposase RayT [Natronincola peptidivorans]